jgi:epsilon-lactone hydrolase
MNLMSRVTTLVFMLVSTALIAQPPASHSATAVEAPTRDTSYIDARGTAHVTRVAPLPATISAEAQQFLSDPRLTQTLTERRGNTYAWVVTEAKAWSKLCPNQLVEDKIAGVPVRIVTPDGMPEANRDKVLLNLHGGGFNSDASSYTETIPIAGYAKIKVVAVLYRLIPEHPYPAAMEDAVAVYKELLKSYKPEHIVIYGTSAGAILTAEVAARLKQLGLPQPAALGIFSGMGDFVRDGDSVALYSLGGLTGHLDPPVPGRHDSEYVAGTDAKDPVLSPIYSDLRGLPPALFVTSTRDMLLSGTVNLHRAYLNAGVDARLVVFDALPHAFWYHPQLPEALEANRIMANFFVSELNK